MDATPLFSVIILAYRSGNFLYTALDSVLAQDYPALEVVVADDSTADFDISAVETYIQIHAGSNLRRAVVYSNQENLGTVKNFNQAIRQTRGTYIKGLGADDSLYNPHVLTEVHWTFEETGVCLLASRVMKCNEHLRPIRPLRDKFLCALPQRSPGEVWRRLCIHNDLPATGIFFTRSFFNIYGFFDERYRLLEDWPTWLRVSRLGCSIGFGYFFSTNYRTNTGFATSLNSDYLQDKTQTFLMEIRPYRRQLGISRYLMSVLSLRLRNSKMVRSLYSILFRHG